jgi:hypothetical protein
VGDHLRILGAVVFASRKRRGERKAFSEMSGVKKRFFFAFREIKRADDFASVYESFVCGLLAYCTATEQ